MIGRLALRSLTAHPIRSAVLAAGFGVGVAVMAILLGVAAIVLQQAQSPALVGGGDVLIALGESVPARMVLAGTLQSATLRPQIRRRRPSRPRRSICCGRTRLARSRRGGIPSLERSLGDPETSQIAGWRDTPADVTWATESPNRCSARSIVFTGFPSAPVEDSWAEWLYFNGRDPTPGSI